MRSANSSTEALILAGECYRGGVWSVKSHRGAPIQTEELRSGLRSICDSGGVPEAGGELVALNQL